jgi:hypothetical protein
MQEPYGDSKAGRHHPNNLPVSAALWGQLSEARPQHVLHIPLTW